MKYTGSFLALISLFFSCILSFPIMSQTKEGFYDTNNYDLKNLPGYDPDGDVMKDVDQPPTFTRPQLSTPKDVRTKYDPLASIPGAGALLPSQLQNPNSNSANNQNQASGLNSLSKSPINPLTGELNPAALQNQTNRSRNKKEAQKKMREEFDDEAVYEETAFRRGYIIFFLTLPFALGVSAGVAAIALQSKTAIGSLIMITGTGGLAGTNVYLDKQRLEEHRKAKAAAAVKNP